MKDYTRPSEYLLLEGFGARSWSMRAHTLTRRQNQL